MKIEEKYPKNFQEFLAQFPDEQSCWQYLIDIRWSEGYVCSNCNSDQYWLTSKHKIHCSDCQKEFSITSGTIFQDSKKPLLLWFHIMWWVVAQKTGASANNLMDFMGFGSYETAWTWLRKLRGAMVRVGREKLSGTVEVDETYIGGEEVGGKQGRGAETKCLVVVATECIGKKIGRVRFRIIPDASKESLIPFIEENIERQSTVITDGWSGYSSLSKRKDDYVHEVKTIKGSGKEAHELLPHVHMVDSLLKRWINGTHQGKISPKYLGYYLDEFAFRFNRKLSTHRGKLFYRLMQQAVVTSPETYNDIKGQLAYCG